MGVRGIRLEEGDHIIDMAILRHVEATSAEAKAYLKQASAMRRDLGSESGEDALTEEIEGEENGEISSADDTQLSPERYAELGAQEQFVLSVSVNGYGKRT